MNNRLSATLWLFAIGLVLQASSLQAAEIKGVTFAERHLVDQTELRITGMGVLTWALLFDVYVGAFYLPKGMSGERWAEDVPKRLELSYLRSISAEDFSRASDKLLRKQLPPGQYQALAERLQEFYRLFRDIRPGDRYSLTYTPAAGTELRLNEELLGAAPGADFAVAYFGLWLGPEPIDKGFRDRLLKGG
ncbi:Chalcone isomerase-like [Geoalkalibacter ferrihydriticus]|uniref:Chalcone isomerase domain-containing protein n=2 Tax=Geoalkalibacter ferrihydriticus TaxID=392333 RepID=A0A0C2DSW7_9BACT|nr:chalcone isomerase family protein [Geoalkalibacter ferrihydriticus]KIH76554.1 hypothetical protein GFER_10305 [Geoalkalibacter ferrihydriticus DSM 17813]SDM01155.1 Chalcone isomerase-like [Geoalkalibacter ferrihydriticus]